MDECVFVCVDEYERYTMTEYSYFVMQKLQEQVTMLEQVCQSVDSEHSRDGQVVQHLAEAACR